MRNAKTMLCALDFSVVSSRELEVAVALAERTGARLVLLHNDPDPSSGLSKAWEWQEVHRGHGSAESSADAQMAAAIAQVAGRVPVEGRLTTGTLAAAIRHLTESLPADLVILGTHGASTADHASLAERVIGESPAPVLVIPEHDASRAPLRLPCGPDESPLKVLTAVELELGGTTAPAPLTWAFELARLASVELHLLHVLGPTTSRAVALASGDTIEGLTEAARERVLKLVPADLQAAVRCAVEQGSAGDAIVAYAERTRPQMIVLGEHTRGWLARFLTRDTAQTVLHGAPCPVLFVPPGWRPAE